MTLAVRTEATQVTAVFCRYQITSSSHLPKYLANDTRQSSPEWFVGMGSCEHGKWGSCRSGEAHTAFLGSPSLTWDLAPGTPHALPSSCHVPWALQIALQGTGLKADCSNCRRVAWCINLPWQKLLPHQQSNKFTLQYRAVYNH